MREFSANKESSVVARLEIAVTARNGYLAKEQGFGFPGRGTGMTDTSSLGYKLAHSTDRLPTIAPVVVEVLRVVSDSRATSRELAKVIGKDVGMSASVLKLSNSAYYAHPRRVDSLEQAVFILGRNEIRNLVMVAGAHSAFTTQMDREIFNRIWRHMLLAAYAADLISNELRASDTGIAYVAGLLHDVGKLVIGLYFPEEYKRHLDELHDTPCRLAHRERKVFGIDHQDVGGMLLEHWQFPPELVEIATRHHGTAQRRPLVGSLNRIIELADWVAYAAQGYDPPDDPVLEVLHTVSDQNHDISLWIERVKKRFDQEAATIAELA